MTTDRERHYFHQPPAGDALHCRGRIYDRPGDGAEARQADLASLARRPELLNQREADLALVSYDAQKRRWRLVRDFGVTPLYYALLPDGLAWSFTYAGLLELLGHPRPDEATLFDYLATHYRYIFREPARTFHQGVRQVPAGAYVDIDERACATHTWLDLSHDPETFRLGPEEATAKLMALIRESVQLRARAATRPAFTISSGLDSSTVASLAALELGPIDAFSVGYEGPGAEEYDETAGVGELTRGKDWRWTHLALERPDLIGEARRLIHLTHSPIVTVTWLAYYLMARQLDGFDQVFNGLGGDESLAGEFTHFFYFFAELRQAGDENRLKEEVAAWSRLHDHPVFKKNEAVLASYWQRNLDFQTGQIKVDQEVYQANWRFFEPDWLAAYGQAQPPMPGPYPNFLSNRLFQEISYETTPPTLWGLFMANQALGLTGVSPLATPRLFRLSLSLPGAVKYDCGLTKALLRRGLKGILPESLRLSPKKTGFNAPIHQWFNDPKVAGPALEMLLSGPLAGRGWLKKGAAEQIFKEHQSGQANHMMLLWPLLNASLFLE
ncbi:MAG: asparagine synthase C-terminal domain-containing protein [Candidatus Adiutrix sp.]|jgi:asparagine synthase (glutamine-hydrolysing)|nr:asparagine synthase C-terminal domain-containing protein [Candidatus Adiutrix sp.]